jgi:hypothetical protein
MKCETVRCRDVAASSLVAKVRANFSQILTQSPHNVTVKSGLPVRQLTILTANWLVIMVAIFWITALCSWYMNQHFAENYCLHLQDRIQVEKITSMIDYPEDGGGRFLRNVRSYANYTELPF